MIIDNLVWPKVASFLSGLVMVLAIAVSLLPPPWLFSLASWIAPGATYSVETVRQGHKLGNHMTEDRASIRLSPKEFTASLIKVKAINLLPSLN